MNQYPNFNFKNDLTDGGTVRVTLAIPRDLPVEYIQHEYKLLQEKFSINLYDAIQHCRHPVVVELIENKETRIQDKFDTPFYTEVDFITLDARLTPVESNNIVMPILSLEPVFSNSKKPEINFYRDKYYKVVDKILDFFGVK